MHYVVWKNSGRKDRKKNSTEASVLFFYTRLIERKNLPILHAKPHPNGRKAESASPARVADSQFARKHMLSQSLPAARAFFPHYPINIYVGGMGACPHG